MRKLFPFGILLAACAAASMAAANPASTQAPASASTAPVDCASERVTCGTLDTCEQACGFLHQCGVTGLDRDKDGIPCESLCRTACDAPS